MNGVWREAVLVAAVVGIALGAGCKGNIGALNTLDLVPDQCNSAQDALNNPSCYLTLGQWREEYISDLGDQDWFSVDVGQVDARSIVHVVAGYFPPDPDAGVDAGGTAFNTAVNLSVNVLDQDGVTSEGAGKDLHGTAPPKPIDLTFRYSKPSTRLIILLKDDTGTKLDNKQKYRVKVEVLPDPDVNEPNDGAPNGNPTPVTLTSGPGGVLTGQCATGPCSGYLATPNDKDLFSVTAPAGNYVMYVGLSQDPSVVAPPPHRYRLQYYIYDPTGLVVAEGDAPPGSQFSANLVSIATAELLKSSGSYTISVQGYRDTQTVGDVPGDLEFKYLLTLIIVPLQDATEGTTAPYNNDFTTAYVASTGLGIGASASVIGRTSYHGDQDWYAFTVSASGVPTLLHYTLTPGTGTGRFPELPTKPVRQLSVYTTQVASAAECLDQDAGVCPITGSIGSVGQSRAISSCGETPPKCLESFRAELPTVGGVQKFPNLRNFEGVLQVPPSGAARTYYFRLEPLGDLTQNLGYWADDKDYTLVVQHLAEPDPPEAVPDPTRAADLSGGALAVNGYLSFGPGQLKDAKPPNLIVADDDYDGRGDDLDSYQIALPITGLDTSWALSYSVPVGPNGTDPAYDLGLSLAFCDNRPDAGTGAPPCYAMVTSPKYSGGQLGLFYDADPLADWWNNSTESPGNTIPLEVVYDRQVSAGNVVTTVRPYGCHCFEQRFVLLPGSFFVMNVFPVNRTSWSVVPYSISMGTSAYPYSFTPNAGGSHTCPSPCHFTFQ